MSTTLADLGYDDATASWVAACPGATAARVSRTDRGAATVLTAEGEETAALARSEGVVTGDWVAMVDGRVVAVAPRRGALTRADPGSPGTGQILAANIDLVFVVAGADRPRKAGKMERATVLAWEAGARPVIVLTKADLIDDPGGAAADAAAMAPGVDVVVTSALTGQGCAELAALLSGGRTAAVLGESGSGKSTLVNRLAGREVVATGTVRHGDHKGRHTTTARHLVPLSTGGVLLDTPGLRQRPVAERQRRGPGQRLRRRGGLDRPVSLRRLRSRVRAGLRRAGGGGRRPFARPPAGRLRQAGSGARVAVGRRQRTRAAGPRPQVRQDGQGHPGREGTQPAGPLRTRWPEAAASARKAA